MNDVSVAFATEGGFVAITSALNVTIIMSSFTNLATSNRGGVFLFQNVLERVNITNNTFSNTVSVGNGGAISFSVGTTFIIYGSHFTSCVSAQGQGGAVASSSSASGQREIINCVFAGNLAFRSIGLDIYDDSNSSSLYYTHTTVVNSYSSSSTDGDYFLFVGTQVCPVVN
jgi:hypothetical protein